MVNLNELDLTDQLVVGKQVDKGGFANISRGILYRQSHPEIEVAIKSLRMIGHITDTVEGRISKRFHREVLLWRKLQHPNVVPLLGYSRNSDGSLNMVSPWYQGGNVILYLRSHPQSNRLALALDAIDGLIYIHSVQVAHGDLKGENVLVNEFGRASLCDFGMSRFIDETNRIRGYTTSHGDLGGTYNFMCPELFEGQPKSTASDMWAAGSLIVQILTDTAPYHGAPTIASIYGAIMNGQPPSTNIDGKIEAGLWNWIEKCWNKTPTDRPTAAEMRIHLALPSLNTESRLSEIVTPDIKVAHHTSTKPILDEANLSDLDVTDSVFSLNLEQILAGAPIDAACGVLQIYVISAKGIKGGKLGGGLPDPYVSLSINGRAELARTKFKSNTTNPHWASTHFILLSPSDMGEELTFLVKDHRKDIELGNATFHIRSVLEDTSQEGNVSMILKDGKERGQIMFDVSYFPVLKPVTVDGKQASIPESNVGICRLVIHQANELDASRGLSNDLNPSAEVYLDGASKPHHVTNTFRHSLSPIWESPTEFLVPNKWASVIMVKVINNRDLLKDVMVGYISVRLLDLLDSIKGPGNQLWFPLTGCKAGKIRMSAEWKPLDMAGSLQGARVYVPPIGIIRLWLKKATALKNVEATLGGNSDPYVCVLLNGVIKARSDVVNNTLSPEWDQIIYVPIHSLSEVIILNVMDYQSLSKDRSLGTVELKVADLAVEDSSNDKYPYSSTGRTERALKVEHYKGTYVGTLEFTAEFIPSLNLRGFGFGKKNEQEIDDHRSTGSDEGTDPDVPSGGEKSASMSDKEMQKVPGGFIFNRPKKARSYDGPTKATSVDTTITPNTSITKNTANTVSTADEANGVIEMSREELLQNQSGIIIVGVKSTALAKKARLEVIVDDSYWPAFSTERSKATNDKWDQVGECFVKELDFGKMWLRLNANEEGEKDDIIGDLEINAMSFLEQCLEKEAEFELVSKDGRYVNKLVIVAKYFPVSIRLEPRETIINMGIVRVDLLDGKGIRGADRSGKLDVFVVFNLNDELVYKSHVKKKTYTPTWNENFTVMIPSRLGASFVLEVFDWNQIIQAKSLGIGLIELSDLEPFQAAEHSIPINSQKTGENGEIRVRLMFQPEIVRKSTSNFSTAGRAMSQIGAVSFGAGTVGKKAKGLFSSSWFER